MKTIGFIISHKCGERRRALLPSDIINSVKNPSYLYFERGYGRSVGYEDEAYQEAGCNIVSREEAMSCDVICDVKLGDADYLESITDGKVLYGWAHAVQNVEFTTKVIDHRHTVIAWEEMFEGGRYIFYRNREIAGEAAVMHAFRFSGKMPYDAKVAILGNGQTAKGALRVLNGLGAEVDVFGRKYESLFRKKMFEYDVLINCVMWDTRRTDRIIYRNDLCKMKQGTLIIDVSCDPYLEIETSHPTTIDSPVYEIDGVIHYAVDNTPAMYPITVTKVLSEGIAKRIDEIVEWSFGKTHQDALVIDSGEIIKKEIIDFRARLRKEGCFLEKSNLGKID